ncbi:MAG: 2-oxo acid dehydrogenase subunit E2 [Bradymonadales bacterium]|nr:2-oxo acid dehydrogenase subunit E2 [Bradymonadales bacterium]
MHEFKLPDLGEGIHEAEIIKWHLPVGQVVQLDAPLVDVETDKATVTIPSPYAGRLHWVAGEVGDTVLVGKVLAVIDDATAGMADEPPPPVVAERKSVSKGQAVEQKALPSGSDLEKKTSPPSAPYAREAPSSGNSAPPDSLPSSPRPAAPATRRLARELGVDLRLVSPSGPAGRITPEDVRRHHQQQVLPEKRPVAGGSAPSASLPNLSSPNLKLVPPDPRDEREEEPTTELSELVGIPFLQVDPLPDFERWGPVERMPLRSIRRKTAQHMVTASLVVPHVAHMDEADVTLLEEFRRQEKPKRTGQAGGSLSLLAFVLKAVAAGLTENPEFNCSLDPVAQETVFKKYIHIGVAVDTPRGLIVPVIREVNRKSILQLASELEQLVARTRDNQLQPAELVGGSFTVTNIGALGGTGLIPVVNYPEVAILGMAAARPRPVVVDGEIAIRTMLPLTLSFDHRVADGGHAARFMNELVRRLGDPHALLLET